MNKVADNPRRKVPPCLPLNSYRQALNFYRSEHRMDFESAYKMVRTITSYVEVIYEK